MSKIFSDLRIFSEYLEEDIYITREYGIPKSASSHLTKNNDWVNEIKYSRKKGKIYIEYMYGGVCGPLQLSKELTSNENCYLDIIYALVGVAKENVVNKYTKNKKKEHSKKKILNEILSGKITKKNELCVNNSNDISRI